VAQFPRRDKAMLKNGSLKTYVPQLGRRELFTIILLVVEILIFSIISENFLSLSNMRSVLRNATDMAVIAIGMTMVILMGGVDI
jgi:ribose transport system permease protein